VALIEAKMRERDAMLIEACDAANNDPETRLIEQEMDALPDAMNEDGRSGNVSSTR
jgi:hypothetical protein